MTTNEFHFTTEHEVFIKTFTKSYEDARKRPRAERKKAMRAVAEDVANQVIVKFELDKKGHRRLRHVSVIFKTAGFL